jgi:hypothetical protein
MLNPALLGAVIARATSGHQREAAEGMPWFLSFIVAPLVLHRSTRQALPNRVSTHLATWVARQPAIRAGFPQRASALVEPVREGLRFGLRQQLLVLNRDRLEATSPRGRVEPPELQELLTTATFVGRWLTKLDRPSTAYALFGVEV